MVSDPRTLTFSSAWTLRSTTETANTYELAKQGTHMAPVRLVTVNYSLIYNPEALTGSRLARLLSA